MVFLILMVVRNFGMADAASDNVQNRGSKLEDNRWEKEVVRNSWAEKDDRGKFQEQGRRKNRSVVHKSSEKGEVYLVEGFCVVHREEVFEQAQR